MGKEVVKRGIPNEQACDALVQLIKDNGRWQDPPSNNDAVIFIFTILIMLWL